MLKNKTALLGCTIFVLSLSTAAIAAPPTWSALGTFDYSHSSYSNNGGDSNLYGGQGAVLANFGNGWNLQGEVGYNRASGTALFGTTADSWSYGGTGFYRDPMWAAGASVHGSSTSICSGCSTLSITDYGGFAELYPSDMFTLRAQAGGFTGNLGVGGGWFVGGAAKFYVSPDISLGGNIDYADANKFGVQATAVGGKLEWKPVATLPVSVFGGYTYTALDGAGTGNANTFSFGLTVHLGEHNTTLVDDDRNNAIAPSSLISNLKYAF